MASYIVQKTLPHPDVVRAKLPRTIGLADQVHRDRHEISEIIVGKDPRKLLIIGPCSAWPDSAVVEYAQKLAPLAKKVSSKLKIILRVYTQKPRTTTGWTGPINQSDPFDVPELEEGIFYCRKMMMKAVSCGLALADEALFTHNDGYFVDLLSWVAIGARSAEDQEHRVFASMINHPTGLKNPTSGNLEVAINSVISAQSPHVFALHGRQVETSGNPLAHLILRGGGGKPNFDIETLRKGSELLVEKKCKNPAIIVDASHENCLDENGKKNPELQGKIIDSVLESIKKDSLIAQTVRGFMVESFLLDGNQDLGKAESMSDIKIGQSVTDPCLGWEKTEKLIEDLFKKL